MRQFAVAARLALQLHGESVGVNRTAHNSMSRGTSGHDHLYEAESYVDAMRLSLLFTCKVCWRGV